MTQLHAIFRHYSLFPYRSCWKKINLKSNSDHFEIVCLILQIIVMNNPIINILSSTIHVDIAIVFPFQILIQVPPTW